MVVRVLLLEAQLLDVAGTLVGPMLAGHGGGDTGGGGVDGTFDGTNEGEGWVDWSEVRGIDCCNRGAQGRRWGRERGDRISISMLR